MKRFLPLLILTGFVFGQDVLTHKSGESYKGHYVGKVDEQLVFSIADLNHLFLTDSEIVISMKAVEDRLYWYYHTDDVQYLYFIAVRIDSYDFTPLCQ